MSCRVLTHPFSGDMLTLTFLVHVCMCVCLCVCVCRYALLLSDFVMSNPTLWNVIQSVTRNGRSLLLTFIFALFLVYLFSIVGFIYLRHDFVLRAQPVVVTNVSVDGNLNADATAMEHGGEMTTERAELACTTIMHCLVTQFNHGLRNGGGIGDVMRATSQNEEMYTFRVVYDFLFFVTMILIVSNQGVALYCAHHDSQCCGHNVSRAWRLALRTSFCVLLLGVAHLRTVTKDPRLHGLCVVAIDRSST
eukprot:m.92510 g.92510  ORF g.92510 m.92510 type:complete len:249 (-) comp9960_c0_seq5:601-1347(-)